MSAFDPKPFLANLSQRPGVYRMIAAERRSAVRRQGAQPEEPRQHLLLRQQGAGREDHGDGLADRQRRGHGDRVGDRSAAARIQPDQASSAALQRHAARRQELSVPVHHDRAGLPAHQLLPRHPQAPGTILRSVSERARHARNRAAAAEAVPAAPVQRHVLREPLAAVSAVPDQALLGPVRRADLGRELQAGRRRTRSRCWKAAAPS